MKSQRCLVSFSIKCLLRLFFWMSLMGQWHLWESYYKFRHWSAWLLFVTCVCGATTYREHNFSSDLNICSFSEVSSNLSELSFEHYFNTILIDVINLTGKFSCLEIYVFYFVVTMKNAVFYSLTYWSICNNGTYLNAWLFCYEHRGLCNIGNKRAYVWPLLKHYMSILNASELHRTYSKTVCECNFREVLGTCQLLIDLYMPVHIYWYFTILYGCADANTWWLRCQRLLYFHDQNSLVVDPRERLFGLRLILRLPLKYLEIHHT
jgi:hypothetical protein